MKESDCEKTGKRESWRRFGVAMWKNPFVASGNMNLFWRELTVTVSMSDFIN